MEAAGWRGWGGVLNANHASPSSVTLPTSPPQNGDGGRCALVRGWQGL